MFQIFTLVGIENSISEMNFEVSTFNGPLGEPEFYLKTAISLLR
jgi:hypothetical protein